MESTKQIVCITTSKPSSGALAPSGGGGVGGGSLIILDPSTGGILSSLRPSADLSGKTAMGMSSFSSFPESFNQRKRQSNNTRLAISFGTNSTKRSDSYAMLLSIRSASSQPILHWKCRLPEAEFTGGIIVSHCGHYIVGGGSSGTCYVWNSIGGTLLNSIRAHYRPCNCMTFSDCGRFVITGGADGMLHSFLLMDMVDQEMRKSKRTVAPHSSWSFHHFPITSLVPLSSGRLASGAADGQVIIVELFSKQTIVTFKFPSGIGCMVHDQNDRLYVGTGHGTIYSIDLNAYAMHQTQKQAGMLTKQQRLERDSTKSIVDQVFGKGLVRSDSSKKAKSMSTDSTATNDPSDSHGGNSSSSNSSSSFQNEWIGHNHTITSINIVNDAGEGRLVSGDDIGEVRIWDVTSRMCLHVIHPWPNAAASKNSGDGTKTSTTKLHPITSIVTLREPSAASSGGMFHSMHGNTSSLPSGSLSQRDHQLAITKLVPPLQRFPQDLNKLEDEGKLGLVAVPFLKCASNIESVKFWEARTLRRKRKQPSSVAAATTTTTTTTDTNTTAAAATPSQTSDSKNEELRQAKEQIQRLQDELQRKKDEVERWEKVNNKLIAKLKSK